MQIIHDNLANILLDVVFMCIFTANTIVFFLKIANMCITKRWRGGIVVMQRTATPCTPVRFRPPPPSFQAISPGGEIGRHNGLKIRRLP